MGAVEAVGTGAPAVARILGSGSIPSPSPALDGAADEIIAVDPLSGQVGWRENAGIDYRDNDLRTAAVVSPGRWQIDERVVPLKLITGVVRHSLCPTR